MLTFESCQKSVLVVGDVMLDKYWHGATERISPEAPVPIVKVKANEARAGGAANVALNIAALKLSAKVLGVVGKDSEASELENLLTEKGVQSNFVVAPDQPTITKLRIMSRHQQLLRLDHEEMFSESSSKDLNQLTLADLEDAAAVVLSDYAKGSLQSVSELIAKLQTANIPVLVDPKGTDFGRYKGATLLTPNMSEFEAVVGACQSEDQVVERAMKLLDELALDA
ncbi:PfkB family carbohydrate kinase, partial [Oceanospirillum sp. HFRX-1_2]